MWRHCSAAEVFFFSDKQGCEECSHSAGRPKAQPQPQLNAPAQTFENLNAKGHRSLSSAFLRPSTSQELNIVMPVARVIMDQITPEVETSRSQAPEVPQQKGSSSITMQDEAVAMNPDALAEGDKTVTISHRCEGCGQPAAPDTGAGDRNGKTARHSRRKRPSIRPEKNLVISDSSDDSDDDSRSLSLSPRRSSSGSNVSNIEDLSASINLEFLSGNPRPARVDILYKVKCSEKGQLDKTFYSVTQFSGLEVHQMDTNQVSVIEVISGVKGKSLTPKLKGQRRTQFQQGSQGKGLKFGENFRISEVKKTSLVVHSEALQIALRHVVKYYPSQTMTGRKVTFQHPYQPLFIYYERIKAYKHDLENGYKIVLPEGVQVANSTIQTSPTGTTPNVSLGSTSTQTTPAEGSTVIQDTYCPQQSLTFEERTAYDIGVLVNFLLPEYQRSVEPERAIHARGLASYKMLWLLLEPGIEVYGLIDGQYASFVVSTVTGTRRMDHESTIIIVWSLASAGDKITRHKHDYEILEFGGEREITSLDVFPCKYLDIKDRGETRRHLETQGRRYYDILRELPMHMTYSGKTLDQKPNTVSDNAFPRLGRNSQSLVSRRGRSRPQRLLEALQRTVISSIRGATSSTRSTWRWGATTLPFRI